MNFSRLAGALALALGLAVTQARAGAPLEAYGGLPSIESVDISPDGTKLAVIMSNGEQRTALVKSVADGKSTQYGLGTVKIRRLDWVGDDHLIITTSQTAQIPGLLGPRREWMMGFDLDLANNKVEKLLRRPPRGKSTGSHIGGQADGKFDSALDVLAGAPQVRNVGGSPTLFVRGITFPGEYGVLTVFRINFKKTEPDVVEVGDRYTRDIVLGQDGTPVAKSTYNPETGRWALRVRSGNGWKDAKVVEALTDEPDLIGLGRDGRSVLVVQGGEKGAEIREVSPEGVWSEPLEVLDADGPIYDPETHKLIGLYALVGDEDRYTFFDPADQRAWNAVRAAFKNDRVRLESWSRDRKKIVVHVDSPTEGPAYAFVDLNTKRASYIGGTYQKLQLGDVSKMQPVKFKAADGKELSGYLTLPNGREAKNLPLVVFPHGGPASRDTMGFDWWAQAMASRGYAVLQVNFRGSEGFGWSFLEAGFGEWGRKMQTDLSDGVRHLAGQGVIDPKRVCIVGGSYGGYAALAGAAIDRGVYRCAASVAGVSDLKRFVDWSRANNGQSAFRYWTRFMGAEQSRDPALRQISPAAHADKVTIPVLLVHGRDDTVVPLEQSRIMAEALQKAGKPVELVVQKGEDHWLSRGETRLETLRAVVAFLEKHNPPS